MSNLGEVAPRTHVKTHDPDLYLLLVLLVLFVLLLWAIFSLLPRLLYFVLLVSLLLLFLSLSIIMAIVVSIVIMVLIKTGFFGGHLKAPLRWQSRRCPRRHAWRRGRRLAAALGVRPGLGDVGFNTTADGQNPA